MAFFDSSVGTGARPKQQRRDKKHSRPSSNLPRPPETPREVQEQDDELMAMASIFEENVFSVLEGSYSGHFLALPGLPASFTVTGLDEFSGKTEDGYSSKPCQLNFLTPIELHFRLPNNYPSTNKPSFKLSCKWLNNEQLTELCRRLDEIWSENEGNVILFLWTAFLTEDALPYLGIRDRLDLSWVPRLSERRSQQRRERTAESPAAESQPTIRSDGACRDERALKADLDPRVVRESLNRGTLLQILQDYNKAQTERAFNASSFSCAVCFERRSGAQCMAFNGCDHVYCKQCMRCYFETQIQQGSVKCLTCPNDKCPSQALPSQVRELVAPELFAKYDQLLLACTLDSMTDIIYCPRVVCQCAVLLEPNCNIGSCPGCFFVFCVFCRMGYHGVEPCKMKTAEFQKLFDTYHNGTLEERAALEARYGKLRLQQLVERMLSESWVKENSQECPSCRAHIEKNDGCNKMTCWKCNCFFCWLCMTRLDTVKPYEHFDQKSGTCFGRLFTGTELEDDEDDGDDFPDLDEDVEFGMY